MADLEGGSSCAGYPLFHSGLSSYYLGGVLNCNYDYAAPSATSIGYKIKTYPNNQYGIGVEASTQWYSANVTHRFYTTDGSTWTNRFEVNATDVHSYLPLKSTTATFPSILGERTSSNTNSVYGAISVMHNTSGDMVDGFGVGLYFYIKDSAAVDNQIAYIAGVRDGADNTGKLEFHTYSAGSNLTPFTITNTDVVLASVAGNGYCFWSSTSAYKIYMADYGATGAGRLDSTSDYNMYFRMSSGTNRGFVFQGGSDGTTNLFQVDGGGKLWLANGDISCASTFDFLNGGNAQGCKMGYLLVADSYSYATPSANNAVIKGTLAVGKTSATQALEITGNMISTGYGIFPSGIYGASSGCPDATIWAVSPTYPTYGIFYNEGSPDYIEFKSNGNVTAKISLDAGDFVGGTFNTFTVGYGGGAVNTNTALGYQVLAATATGGTSVGVGYQALNGMTSGYSNIAVGYTALALTTVGACNTAVGKEALYNNVGGWGNTAIGYQAMWYAYNVATSTAMSNTAVGASALRGSSTPANNSGQYNVAIGTNSLIGNTSGSNNSALGKDSLYSNTTGNYNVVLGHGAMYSSLVINQSVAVGYQAMYYMDSNASPAVADKCSVAVGYRALYGSTTATNNTGYWNIAVGGFALAGYTSGSQNVAMGYQSSLSTLNGGGNVSIGNLTMTFGKACNYCTAVGYMALNYADSNASPAVADKYNTAVGYCAGSGSATPASNTGYQNTAIGGNALVAFTSGYRNTALGYNALSSLTTYYNCTGVGYNAQATSNDQVILGDGNSYTYVKGATVYNLSDYRDKADIKDLETGLNFIMMLRPVDYKWDYRDDYYAEEEYLDKTIRVIETVNKGFDPSIEESGSNPRYISSIVEDSIVRTRRVPIERDGSKKRVRSHYGLIAQEVKQVLDDLGIDFGGYQDHTVKGGEDVLALGYTEFIAPMIKAIQELKVELDDTKAQLASLLN